MEVFSWIAVIAIGLLAAYVLGWSIARTVRSGSTCAGCPLASAARSRSQYGCAYQPDTDVSWPADAGRHKDMENTADMQ